MSRRLETPPSPGVWGVLPPAYESRERHGRTQCMESKRACELVQEYGLLLLLLLRMRPLGQSASYGRTVVRSGWSLIALVDVSRLGEVQSHVQGLVALCSSSPSP